MPSQQNFVLPGTRADPKGVESLIVLAAFAHSRVWNHRRLESHWYGLWNRILSDLLFDLGPNIFLVPQHTIYFSEKEAELYLASQVDNDGDTPEEPSDHQSPLQGEDDGKFDENYSDSNISFGTAADGNANELNPDFVVLVSAVGSRTRRPRKEQSIKHPRFPSSYSAWDTMRIVASHPALIVQVKRSPPRSLPIQKDFVRILNLCLGQAVVESEASATLVFSNKNNKKLKKIILVAVSGEWWRFSISFRDDFEASSEDSESEDKETKGKKKKGKQKSGSKARGHSFQRHQDIGSKNMAQPKRNVNDAMPAPGNWSENILFGTPPSNQRLYLIHELLKEIQDSLVDEFEQAADTVSQVGDLAYILTDPKYRTDVIRGRATLEAFITNSVDTHFLMQYVGCHCRDVTEYIVEKVNKYTRSRVIHSSAS
jgi:hypothetical protein